MHRFIHLGDLHLGPNERNEDRIAALDQAIREGCAQPIAAWLWPGDLNNNRMTIHDKNVLADRVQRMANHAPVCITYGNHDLPGDLDFLARLAAAWPIYVIARPEVLTIRTATGAKASIFVLPYPTRAGLVAAGVASQDVVQTAKDLLEPLFISAAAQLVEATARGEIALMIGHVNVGGSIVSTGQPNIGKEIELDPLLLDRLGPIYKGLNHIHKAQPIAGAHYAGSLCRLDWGEVDPKSYTEITYGPGASFHGYAGDGPEDGYPDGWAYDYRYCALPIAPLYLVEGTLTRDGFLWSYTGDATDGVVDQTIPSFAGAEVRVRVRFAAAEKGALNFDQVKAPFVGAKRIDVEPIADHTRAVRAPEVAAAKTLEEKVQAFTKNAGLPWTASLGWKLAQAQAVDGAAFLTSLESSLSGAASPHSEADCLSSPTDVVPDNEPQAVGR